MTIRKATSAEARRQAAWIVGMEPWRGLGYQAAGLARWLGRRARLGQVWLAWQKPRGARAEVVGVLVLQPEVLLGQFIALLAVPPPAAGRGIGRALVDKAAAHSFAKSRWLYTSSDLENRPAAAFYRHLGFARVGKLPDLVRQGRTEILWRRARPSP